MQVGTAKYFGYLRRKIQGVNSARYGKRRQGNCS